MRNSHLFDLIGRPGVYVAGSAAAVGLDGTAVRTAATTLDLAGLPFVPVDVQFLGVIMVDTAGRQHDFPANLYRHSYAAPTLTVANGAFTATAQYLVLFYGQNKAYNPVGYNEVYLMSALNVVNDAVAAAPIIPPEIVCGGTLTSNAVPGQTTQLVGTSYSLRHGVWMMIAPEQTISRPAAAADTIQMIGAYYTSGHNTIIDAAGLSVAGWAARRTALVEGAINSVIFAPVDDPSKIYTASNTASLVILWVGV